MPRAVADDPGSRLPVDLALIDEEGGLLRLGEVLDRPAVVTLVTLGCGSICPELLGRVAAASAAIDLAAGKDYRLVTIGIEDGATPGRAAAMKRNFVASGGGRIPSEAWVFLTAGPPQLQRLTDAAGLALAGGGGRLHARGIFVVGPDGRIVRYLPAGTMRPLDLRMALLDAGASASPWPAESLRRFCYYFNHDEGHYEFDTRRVLAVLAALIAAMTSVFVGWLRREAGGGS